MIEHAPAIKTHWQKQECKFEVPANLFMVEFGYKHRDRIQIRLEDDGSVYLGDYRESRRYDEPARVAGTVSFEVFAAEWPQFVRYLLAKSAELTSNSKGKAEE